MQSSDGSYWLWVLSAVSAVMVLGALAVERWLAEHTYLSTLLTYAPQFGWILPPAIMLIWSAWGRQPWAAALNAASLLIALFALAGFQIPLGTPAPSGAGSVQVATWNVKEYGGDLTALREKLMGWDCDVVCLQEAEEAGFEKLLPGYEQVTMQDLRTFVRGEVLDTEVIASGDPNLRPVLSCEVRTRGRRLKVANVHISMSDRGEGFFNRQRPMKEYLPDSVRVRGVQFDSLLRWLPCDVPLVVVGDFNTPPGSRFCRRMRQRLSDAFAASGVGFGYTFLPRETVPVFRIDYVWTANGAQPAACRVAGAAPSDHKPVIAEVRLPGRAGDRQ